MTSYISKEDGIVQKLVEAVVRIVPGTANISQDRIVSALSALYIFVTFAGTGAVSAAGQAAATEGGWDNNRISLSLTLYLHTNGLPLQIRASTSLP